MVKERPFPEVFPNLTKLPVKPTKDGSLSLSFGATADDFVATAGCATVLLDAFFFVCANAELANIKASNNIILFFI
jgi:hypothetical protein